jgi:hypothetical protein
MESAAEWSATGVEYQGGVTARGSIPPLSAMDDEPGRRYRLRFESGRPRKGWVSNTPSSAKDTEPDKRAGLRWNRSGL